MQFDCDISDVITELKAQLDANGIQMFHKSFDSGDNYMICCPYHALGQERRPSCGIRKSDGTLHCFACDVTVGLDEMIANCFGYNDPAWGYRWLLQNFATVQVEQRKEIVLDLDRGTQNAVKQPQIASDVDLTQYEYKHPYLYERGLTDKIIEFFKIGYDSARDEITFPVRDINGNCMFIARRSVKTKRFDLPKNIDKPLYGRYEVFLFSMQQLGRGQSNKLVGVPEVYVCEGLFDCLRLWCNGKLAVAGFGCLFSDYQLKLLKELPTRKLILALDNDKAGKNGADKIRKAVKNKLITEVVIPDGYKDIGELSDEQIQQLQEVF